MPPRYDNFECGTCGRAFPAGWRARDNHCRATGHAPPDFECETCSRWFRSRRACDQHMDATDHWQRPYTCSCCSLTWRTEERCVQHEHEDHYYCNECCRGFESYNNIRMHLNSRRHRGDDMECPFCPRLFTTATGVTHHLETGACPNAGGLNRDGLYRVVRSKDPQGLVSKKLIRWTGSCSYEASASSWNGNAYECYFCHRTFGRLPSLNQHLNSPTHQQALYHCPNPACRMDFKNLAGIINHLESESCGFMRFEQVQGKIGNIVSGNRLITF
ncbi:hypothetical protein PCL_03002 [Purpureocillium lilacinum]|uniref:C2H2-type domain-containing protein n=1 Tax=Purpureocillium lilacinum TaxID=33203 RepID=A0A2U3DZG3_PURLI|nr:hypothetical protein PCL_03002 [Purpureocillium lilacinum]